MYKMSRLTVVQASGRRKTVEELTDQLWLVSRCWNHHPTALIHRMSVEKAIALLREVMIEGAKYRAGQKLSQRAAQLLHDIVFISEEPEAVREAVQKGQKL